MGVFLGYVPVADTTSLSVGSAGPVVSTRFGNLVSPALKCVGNTLPFWISWYTISWRRCEMTDVERREGPRIDEWERKR